MIINFNPKRRIELEEANKLVAKSDFVLGCEAEYSKRVAEVCDFIEKSEAPIVLATGPSASGKTTSCKRLAQELESRGKKALVISLDNFFKNLEDYPRDENGELDMDSVYAVDIEAVNKFLVEIIENGFALMPQFDFIMQGRKKEKVLIDVKDGGILIVEGIHALNPLLYSTSVPIDKLFKIYIGLREEYYQDGERVYPTRDIRITRRFVRDRQFRNYPVEATFKNWKNILRGEDLYIKPFKDHASIILDTSFTYEPSMLSPIVQKIASDPNEGGIYREELLRINDILKGFDPITSEDVPKNSMLREFIGGLDL